MKRNDTTNLHSSSQFAKMPMSCDESGLHLSWKVVVSGGDVVGFLVQTDIWTDGQSRHKCDSFSSLSLSAMNDDCQERRRAEIEFVNSAYASDEAWCEISAYDGGVDGDRGEEAACSRVVRRLKLDYQQRSSSIITTTNNNNSAGEDSQYVLLKLDMPLVYPQFATLEVSASIDDYKELSPSTCSTELRKLVINSLPILVSVCREKAQDCKGDEAIFTILDRAEVWVNDEWREICERHMDINVSSKSNQLTSDSSPVPTAVLGRRLIYSHHLISKIKRGDIKHLAAELKLTGYMKVGWPGLIIIEGEDGDCNKLYDTIRKWAWKYLVVRGEQQESIPHPKTSIDTLRKFSDFREVDDMSVVARHCREVGLENLFRTSMKVYDNEGNESQQKVEEEDLYGALVQVDHMNNGKAYRKWLRKISQELDCNILIRQLHASSDSTLKPRLIVVGIIGEQNNVSKFLKQWRISRVDVDSHGKPCLERMMSVLIEGGISITRNYIDWDDMSDEDTISVPKGEMLEALKIIGGDQWANAIGPIS